MRVQILGLAMLATVSLWVLSPAVASLGAGFMCEPVNIGVPLVIGPGFSAMMPFAKGSYVINEARTDTLTRAFDGSLAISFLKPDSQSAGGPPVVSPVIAQTVSQTVSGAHSYFFNDFLAGA